MSNLARKFNAADKPNRITADITVLVDLGRDFYGWEPDRVAAFMAGMAQVLGAHRGSTIGALSSASPPSPVLPGVEGAG